MAWLIIMSNLLGSIFTPRYTFCDALGFQVQVDTCLNGNVTIGNLGTSYSLLLNGMPFSGSGNPSTWAQYPAIAPVNLSGNVLSDASNGFVTVSGTIISTDTIYAFGNIESATGNIVTTGGGIVTQTLAVAYNAAIGGVLFLPSGGLSINGYPLFFDANGYVRWSN